ncbi:hypothetical protein VHEMI06199 [[Torrubiella] hemipterigena]|uniref:Rhodopsin domain-containing protein n=1 Tax=[Torrubiella] hemipterigena TaxID=1531966 RepID=A0A0A1SZY7_9HYPO|nr:hypothetical protein VHEMI06199 [[Torrubiella] hemipterigena]
MVQFSQQTLLVESWTLFGLGVLVVICRMASRRMKLGAWNKLGLEDYLMVFALANFAGVAYSINEVAANGSSYLPAETVAGLTPEGIAQAVYGSVMTFVLEIVTITGLWTIKTCLLLLYSRITKGGLHREHMIVKFVGVFCLFSYLLVMLLFLFYWCQPIRGYFLVPYEQEQCATYYHHLIFATAFNILTDLMLFLIPIPIIIRTSMPVRRKIILCFILGLGVFNILASILNRYYNFTYDNSYVFLYWYIAEMGVAMFVGNLPLCYPLLRLALGKTQSSSHDTPPYIVTIGSERKRRPRGRDETILNTVGGTQWDKLDEQEHAVDALNGESTLVHSERGSEIELVIQGRCHGHHHQTTVSSHSAEDQRSNHSPSSSRDGSNGKENIMVVRTVDVSTSGRHK